MTDPTLKQAQQDLAKAYVRGAPGVLVSGLVWLGAGFAWTGYGPVVAFWALFFGGMAIFPLGLLIAKALFRAPAVTLGKPLERLALESTFVLFAGIVVAWVLLQDDAEQAIAAMAVVVGARYFSFRTLYDEAAFWFLAATFVAIGSAALFGLGLDGPILAYSIGFVEMVAAILIHRRWQSDARGAAPTI